MKALTIIIINIIIVITSTSVSAAINLSAVNQKVSNRFEEDISRLAAVMEELRDRKGITETRVAFGGIDTPIKNADYWVTYAAEAVAFQKAQKYYSKDQLRAGLETLRGKILQAKAAVGGVLPNE
ncbi:hypothetical protein A3C26_01170 [Candidatus Daviesbacteria bacterium RIFCSPHIGHO2_02_FULL_39_12]|uniref:Uncharacterized protein n=2 Tax=Candidatus Daviesiibacteriota TaxID=1752718 RepID=A0A1F5J905_9BACT|nr:MAG: hypothetical protein A3C26_01170 [Candidatus Daviesbacteria bacterium RIFCSPHIGHO2_02_FULL_39_12]OGE72279.1 MAG: hypothetical protein A3H40_02180 [Candidatus Daviesbacteria bacterium RIFCSPLOWO2_02_FULL_38_15]